MTRSDSATRILLEIVNGDEHPERDTPEEARLRVRLRAAVRKIKAAGGIVDVPFD